MNQFQLTEAPENPTEYVTQPARIETDAELEHWLRIAIQEGYANIRLPSCNRGLISKLETELKAAHYRVQFVGDDPMWADFYLEVFGHPK